MKFNSLSLIRQDRRKTGARQAQDRRKTGARQAQDRQDRQYRQDMQDRQDTPHLPWAVCFTYTKNQWCEETPTQHTWRQHNTHVRDANTTCVTHHLALRCVGPGYPVIHNQSINKKSGCIWEVTVEMLDPRRLGVFCKKGDRNGNLIGA